MAHLTPTFTAEMTTYYYRALEEALKKAKAAGEDLVASMVGKL